MKTGRWTPWLLLAPFLLVLMVFLASLANGILQGFGFIPAFGLNEFTLDHFKRVIMDDNLLSSIKISLYVALVSASATISLATLLSYGLVNMKKEHSLLYSVLRMPMYIPWVVTGLLMIHLLSGSGWLARLFLRLGFAGLASGMAQILHSPGQAGIILAFVWASTPFACFLIVTVMAAVADSLGEAAATLGAGVWQRFWNVTLPLCFPVIRSTFLIILLSCFGSYEIPLLLGMTVPRALPVEVYHLYGQFDRSRRPQAMALNTIMLVIALALAALVRSLHLPKRSGGTQR